MGRRLGADDGASCNESARWYNKGCQIVIYENIRGRPETLLKDGRHGQSPCPGGAVAEFSEVMAAVGMFWFGENADGLCQPVREPAGRERGTR